MALSAAQAVLFHTTYAGLSRRVPSVAFRVPSVAFRVYDASSAVILGAFAASSRLFFLRLS